MRLLAKLSGSRTILHIQDFEVDAMLGLGLASEAHLGILPRLAKVFERDALLNVDSVSTISQSMMKRAQDKGVSSKKLIFFPIGLKWKDLAKWIVLM